ncbi:hypothetical protein BGZ81_004354 [Podila clonocystis]|nr:hypothetical protein BGZ81_004354 [Podila clonocystis]
MPGMMPDGNHVPTSQPSPFERGFPFHSGTPAPGCKSSSFKFRRGCGRPNAGDTETSKGSEKNPAGEGSSSSFQFTPAGRYGWVWNGAPGSETVEPTPLYTASDEEMTDASHPPPPHHHNTFPFGPFGGRGGFGPFRGRGGSRGAHHPFHGHHGDHSHHGHPHRRHSGSRSGGEKESEKDKEFGAEEKLKRRQTFHEQRQAMMQSRKEQLQEQRQAIALQREAMEQQRQAQDQQRRAQDEQRKAQEKQRKIQEEQRRKSRVSELVDRSRPVGGGSLAGIWPTATAAAAAGAASEVVAATDTDANPFADPEEIKKKIKKIVSMGFQDNAELRSVMRDFGGEVEAVVEFLISSRQ